MSYHNKPCESIEEAIAVLLMIERRVPMRGVMMDAIRFIERYVEATKRPTKRTSRNSEE